MDNFQTKNFSTMMTGRQSVRNFDSNVTIARQEISEMITEAISAPSACNLQSWHFTVVDTSD
ncbi:hypothetical protein JCM31185_08880 [Furfurilactobacillus curtus]|uniref:Nitroreductase domain-containing protein n=1 Tax=Furfurilactobacillus curtus TaxID=1746200 RepID=A0ABQ5JMX7_9LACO